MKVVAAIQGAWSHLKNPLMLLLSTLPDDETSEGRLMLKEALEVESDPDLDPSKLVIVSALGETDDWTDERVWNKVCPALDEGYQDITEFRLKAKAAEHSITARNAFLAEYMNAPRQDDALFISPKDWLDQQCKMSRDDIWNKLAGLSKGVIAGADFSQYSDLSSVCFVGMDNGRLLMWQQSWVADTAVYELDQRLGGRLSKWIEEGLVKVVKAPIDVGNLAKEIRNMGKKLRGLELVAFDYHDAAPAKQYWDEHNFANESCYQGWLISPGIKKLKDMAETQKVSHGNDDLLAFGVSCSHIQINEKEKWQLKKPKRYASGARIDPVVAGATALHMLLLRTTYRKEYKGKRIIPLG